MDATAHTHCALWCLSRDRSGDDEERPLFNVPICLLKSMALQVEGVSSGAVFGPFLASCHTSILFTRHGWHVTRRCLVCGSPTSDAAMALDAVHAVTAQRQ